MGRRGSVVTEAAQLAEPVLKLIAQRGIRPGLLVAQRVCLQDPDGREDRDRADDQDADQELDRGAPRDGGFRLPPAAGSRMLLFGGRRGGRRAHRCLIGLVTGSLEPFRAQKFESGCPDSVAEPCSVHQTMSLAEGSREGVPDTVPSTIVTVLPLRVIWEPVKSVVPPQ